MTIDDIGNSHLRQDLRQHGREPVQVISAHVRFMGQDYTVTPRGDGTVVFDPPLKFIHDAEVTTIAEKKPETPDIKPLFNLP